MVDKPTNWFAVLPVYVTTPETLAVGSDKEPLVGNPTVVSTVITVPPMETGSVIRVLPGTLNVPQSNLLIHLSDSNVLHHIQNL